MKTFQQKASKLWYILLCTIIVSCSDSSDSPENPLPKPEPVEKEYNLTNNVVELEGDLLKYVSSVKGDTLVYDNSTPANEMPQVGEIILVSQPTKTFPYGFLGKVVKVSKDGNVITEAAALDEAFTYLNVKGTYELKSDEYESRADEETNHKLKGEVPFKMSFISGSLTWGLDAELGFHLNVDKRGGKNIRSGYIDVAWEDYLKLEADLDLDKNKDKDEDKGNRKVLGKEIKLGAINVGPIVLVPVIQPFISYEMKGEIGIGWEAEIRNKHKVRANFNGNAWSMIPLEKEEKTIDYNVKPNITMEGHAFCGTGLALEFRLYGNKNINAAVSAQGGLEASGEITLATEKDDIYNALSEDSLSLALKGGIGMGASAKIFLITLDWEHSLVNKTWWKQAYHIFPSFEDYTENYNETGFTASTVLGRDLLWNSEVGIGLYDGEKFVEVSEPEKYRFEKDFKEKNPLKAVFEDLTEEELNEYSVWSYVKWGEEYIKCERLDPDIIGLWCRDEGWFQSDHVEFREKSIHYYEQTFGIWKNYYYRPWFWNEDEDEDDDILWICDDDYEWDETWKVQKLTADSLVLLDLTEVETPYWEKNIVRFHRINNHSECTVEHKK